MKFIKNYPNPTNGLFTIEVDNQLIGSLYLEILSTDGKKILNKKLEKAKKYFSFQIDLNGEPPGNYLIKLTIDKYSSIKKIMVN
jgi:hypothetical protein